MSHLAVTQAKNVPDSWKWIYLNSSRINGNWQVLLLTITAILLVERSQLSIQSNWPLTHSSPKLLPLLVYLWVVYWTVIENTRVSEQGAKLAQVSSKADYFSDRVLQYFQEAR